MPWREATTLVGLLLLGWPVAILGFGLPFAALLAALAGGLRRVLAAVLAAFLALVPALLVPGSRFFVTAAAATAAAAIYVLLTGRRVGYPELSVCALAGVATAVAVWLVVDPNFFMALRKGLETALLEQGRVWLEWMHSTREVPSAQRLLLEQAFTATAEWSARTWPLWTFSFIWLGSAAGLAFAHRWAEARGALGAKVRVAERCSRFRVPDAWVWVFVTGLAGYLLGPRGGLAHDAALNVALTAAALYACQGVAVGLYYLESRGVRPVTRILLLAVALLLMTLPALVLALFVGLADARLDLRARRTSEPSGPPRN